MTTPLTFGQPPTDNALYYGDCLEWMSEWQSETVDLIYLDPPFNSKQNYNMLYSADIAGDAQYRAFADTWGWDDAAADRYVNYDGKVGPVARAIRGLYRILGECGMLAYLTYMAERLEECHRLLKPAGSLWLHCDPTASHYLKVLLDAVYGAGRFRNEIIWCYPPKGQGPATAFHRKHDVLMYYNKSPNKADGVFRRPYTPLTDEARAKFSKTDADGRQYKDFKGRRTYLDESRGRPVPSWWTDIAPAGQSRREYLGYETQKPVKLLRRIIESCSKPDDLMLDPFCGCGTAVDAARGLGRRFIGIDISSFAVDVMLQRLGDRTIPVYGIPYDLYSARRMAAADPFGFESWAVTRLRGFVPNTRQVADGGVDGRARLAVQPDDWTSRLALAQVKGGTRRPIDGLRAFSSVVDGQGAALGCYITVEPFDTDSARRVTTRPSTIHVGGYPYQRFTRWSIAEHFDERPPPLPPMNNPYTGRPMPQGALF